MEKHKKNLKSLYMEDAVMAQDKKTKLKPYEKLKQVIEELTGRLVIFIAQVDPDAIASAMGLKKIAKQIQPDISVKIVYFGDIGYSQNTAIINKCNLEDILISNEDFEMDTDDKLAIVDSSNLEDSRVSEELGEIIKKNEFSIIIDHHQNELKRPKKDQFFLIEKLGACATIVVELAKDLKVNFDETDKLLMTMAIYTDTDALISASKRDRDAYGDMTEDIDPIVINQFVRHSLPPSYFDNLVKAVTNIQKKDNRLITGLGNVKASDEDHVAIIADQLLQMEGVTLVVVWEIIDNKKARIAARNSDISFSLRDFLKQAFGTNSGSKMSPDSRGKGGALIDINPNPFWQHKGITKTIEQMVKERLEIWIFEES